MKTTININGLDVEFSDQKPTRSGAYWWSWGQTLAMPVSLIETSSGLVVSWNNQNIQHWGGLWSTSPLVPVTEVEKAYKEGHSDRDRCTDSARCGNYATSNARKIVEGEQP